MKKLIIGIILALALAVTAVPVVAANGQKPLDEVAISPNPAPILPGGVQQFSATSEDASNNPVVGVTYTWEVVAGGGTINTNTGLFTAGATTGTFTDTIKVTASKGGITKYAYADVIVANLGVLYSVTISPDTATILPLGTQQFSAIAKDAFGNVVIVNPFWEVSGGGAIDNNTGLFTAGTTTGTFTVKVTATQASTSTTKTDTAIVKVAIPGVLDHVVISPETATVLIGGTKDFNAVGKDAYNQDILTGVTYSWSVTGVGTIDSASGLFSAGAAPGSATIQVSATQGSVTVAATAKVMVTVEPAEKNYRVPAGWSKGKKNGWNGGDTPPGWSKGHKTGWDDEDSPPGLSKGNKTDHDDEEDDD